MVADAADSWMAKAQSKDAEPWERKLLNSYAHVAHAKGDAAQSKLHVIMTASSRSKYDGISSPDKEDLRNIGDDAVKKIRDYGTKTYNSLKSEERRGESAEEWLDILSKSQEDALKENGDVLSGAYKDGHSTIGKFPSDERSEAADFFNEVMTYTSDAWNQILQNMVDLTSDIQDFAPPSNGGSGKSSFEAIEEFGKSVLKIAEIALQLIALLG